MRVLGTLSAMLAPEPQLTACLQVVHRATVLARFIASKGRGANAEQIADLMDAVHNVPVLVQQWDKCDVALLRSMLDAYDRKWNGALLREYDDIVEGRRTP
jgi:hypothetical protein